MKLGILADQSADLGEPATQTVSSDGDRVVIPHELVVLLDEGVIHERLVGVPVRHVEYLLREHLECHLDVGFQLLQVGQLRAAVHDDQLFLRLVDETCTAKAWCNHTYYIIASPGESWRNKGENQLRGVDFSSVFDK